MTFTRSNGCQSISTFSIALMTLVGAQALAETITVDDDGDADFSSIQDAIEYASDGDLIQVYTGTYTGTGPSVIDTLGKAITINGSNGLVVVDGEGARRVVQCVNGEDSSTVLRALVLRGGAAERGGGLYAEGSSPKVLACTFQGNTATFSGGAIYSTEGSLDVIISVFTANFAEVLGGAIHCHNAQLEVLFSDFDNNSAGQSWGGGGGAIKADGDSTLFVRGSLFTWNRGLNLEGWGGAIYSTADLTVIEESQFENNSARWGGAILAMKSPGDSGPDPSLFVDDCAFQNNSADERYGGAIYCARLETTDIRGCDFDSNIAEMQGGGLYAGFNSSASVTVSDCTFTANEARDQWEESAGGGIYASGTVYLTESDFCGNVPDQIEGQWIDGQGNEIQRQCSDQCLSDFNGDGVVDGEELTYLLGTWGTDDQVADLDDDGIVDGADLNVILGGWGACP
jgi:predicted outer membrane repeat protein